jgi:hypothetical protein
LQCQESKYHFIKLENRSDYYAKEKAWLGYISAMYSIRSSAEVQYSIKFFSEKASNGYYYKEAQIIIKFQKQF